MDFESMAKDPVKLEKHWTKKAQKVLLGKKIIRVQYMSADETEDMGWYKRPIAFQLSDNTWVVAQCDDEGNDGGVLTYSHEDDKKYDDWVMPVL
tara:strand:+ start:562 stop:843 length:282 start_codon:yes stop_codon:yes gene_type:complete